MQTKRNDMYAISGEPTSNIVALPNSGSNVIVLDEASLEDARGGSPVTAVAIFVAGYLFARATSNTCSA